jgi:hypothetical protein
LGVGGVVGELVVGEMGLAAGEGGGERRPLALRALDGEDAAVEVGDGLLQLVPAPAELPGAPPVGAHRQSDQAQPAEPKKPPRLPPKGRHHEVKRGRLAECAALPGGLHFERVGPRIHLRVADPALIGAGGPPVEPLKPDPELDRRRVSKVQPGIPSDKRALLGAEAQGVVGHCRVGRVPRRDPLDGGRRRGSGDDVVFQRKGALPVKTDEVPIADAHP